MPSTIGKVLIANRGEIAVRIISSLKKSGITAIGIYSGNDRDSIWIGMCDESYSLGNGSVAETYLNIEKIIHAALETGVDAIHPGYGFLSENYRLAEACEKNNLVFIGPSVHTLKTAGDKQLSHELVRSLGIPVADKISGCYGELMLKSSEIEYPVFAKAVAGGGGRGIRLVNSQPELGNVLQTVSSEALLSFGDDRVYLEKCIRNPRHVEVQILGDMHGNRIHLFERECSVQRRHQKLVEETPAGLSNKLRRAIIDAALKIAGSLDFYSAGTIEFLVDENENFLFLEINPRIQVEHGITEMITGIDIVNEQINIARGNRLSLWQDQVGIRGHAVEVRIYAEDPENNMIPLPGNIHYISLPQIDQSIRADSGAQNGTEISPEYDPLIAKVMAFGNSRADAIQNLRKALGNTVISGIVHNLPLLNIILDHPGFLSGNISTTWLESEYPALLKQLSGIRQQTGTVFPVIASAVHTLINQTGSDDIWKGYWRSSGQIRLFKDKQLFELDYEKKGTDITFYSGEDIFRVSGVYNDEYGIRYMLNDGYNKWYIATENDCYRVSDGHFTHFIDKYSLNEFEFANYLENETNDDNMIRASQPGTVVDIKVFEGQSVNRGDYLLTIESMKLENTILAANEGVISKIHIKTGDRVKKNEPLIHLQHIVNN